jgi:uncharacterized membrane protein HdeD (DUF308 family)
MEARVVKTQYSSVQQPSYRVQSSLNPRFLTLRGILSIAFGILALAWPEPGLVAIALLYGAYAFTDGVFAIATAVRRERHHESAESWGLPIFEGILGIGAGVVTVLWPGVTLFVLSIFVGVWALTTGVLELASAFSMYKHFPRGTTTSKVLLGIMGVLSILLGLAIFVNPTIGAVALLTLVASYAIVFGSVLVWLGSQLKREESQTQEYTAVKAA